MALSNLAHQLIQDEYASWTYSDAHAIVEYLDELSDCTVGNIEFCPVAIRCDVNSYTWEEIREYYSNIDDIADAEDNDELLEVLQDYTSIITHDDAHVVFFTF
jgi:hypothetical protein